MNRPFKFLNTFVIITLSVMLVACQDTIPDRSAVTSGSSTGDTCTSDETLVTDSLPLCDTTPATRPTGAINWSSSCACKDSTVVSMGNCASVCAGKNTNAVETLFATFTVTEAISLSGLGNVEAWCNTLLPGATANPSCQLEAKDESGNVTPLEITIKSGQNSLTANIQDILDFDKTYILTLVEKVSGAKSNSIQFIKFSSDLSTPITGPLKNAPISQYTCLVRNFSTDSSTGDIYYDSAYRLHFYYLPSTPPTPVPAGNSYLICHDIYTYGENDDALFPRFENLPGIFNLWDVMDPRFYDNNGNGTNDVNDLIIQKTKNFGGTVPAGTDFFASFTWPGSPTLATDAGDTTTTTAPLGYYMAPWIDTTTYKSYCLNSTHYNSTNPLYKALGEVIEVDTEGLYVGVKEAETVIDPNTGAASTGYKDYILIRETDLKSVWFYLKNSTPTAPTDDNVASNAVYFYYPLNKTSPFVKTSTQRLYRVRSASELSGSSSAPVSSGGSTSTGTPTTYPPHDRKIGCVPKF